jgi:Family of unknown function (DUF6049)
MTRRPHRAHLIAAVVALAAAVILPVNPAADATTGVTGRAADALSMSVAGITPAVPAVSTKLLPLKVVLTVTNTTDKTLKRVKIEGERGAPITSQAQLAAARKKVTPPVGASDLNEIKPTRPVTVDLGPAESQQVTFITTTGIPTDAGICLCAEAAVYPLYFSAHLLGAGGVDQQLGVTTTYLPAYYKSPSPVRVSWVWPLLGQPHRQGQGDVFTDDLLASDVSAEGRLSRALAVVEGVGASVPMTLVLDPELLDELTVMATTPYRVSATKGRTVPGTGGDAARAWLARLRTVLIEDPDVQVELTPYADPDVESLTERGLTWTTTLPGTMQAHVEQALAGRSIDSTVAWPAGGAISGRTLQTLVSTGVSTVLLNASAVSPKPSAATVTPGLARLAAGGQDIAVGLLSPAVEKYAAQAVTFGGPGAAALPDLMAELGVRAAQDPHNDHVAVIAAPRYVDPSITNAVDTIERTSRSTFSNPVSLAAAVGGELLPTGRSRLASPPASAATLPGAVTNAASDVSAALPVLRSLLGTGDAAANAVIGNLRTGVQRLESSAWGTRGGSTPGEEFADGLTAQVDALTDGVRIIRPSSGSYTLASDNSPLPITVENDLDFAVRVEVSVVTENGLPGFTARATTQTVERKSKRTVRLPTSIARTGRIKVEATLLAPNGTPVGGPVPLTVRSTALGVVGVVITIGAGVVLVLALLIRLARRFGKRSAAPRERVDPDAVAVPEPTP